MKHTYTYIVYGVPPPKHFHGILGEIELFQVKMLLAGGKTLITEQYDGEDPIEWYKTTLEEQEIFVKQSKEQKFGATRYIWLEVDTEKTPIDEFASWHDIDAKDTETLAWRTFNYPVCPATKKECLGLAVKAREICITSSATNKQSQPLMLSTVLDAILHATVTSTTF
jgi:hypothetical protein